MHLLAPGTIVLKERFFFSMVANLPHTELYKLNLHVKKCVHCCFIIKDKINLCVEFSSNNLKRFHVNFTENRVRVMG